MRCKVERRPTSRRNWVSTAWISNSSSLPSLNRALAASRCWGDSSISCMTLVAMRISSRVTLPSALLRWPMVENTAVKKAAWTRNWWPRGRPPCALPPVRRPLGCSNFPPRPRSKLRPTTAPSAAPMGPPSMKPKAPPASVPHHDIRRRSCSCPPHLPVLSDAATHLPRPCSSSRRRQTRVPPASRWS